MGLLGVRGNGRLPNGYPQKLRAPTKRFQLQSLNPFGPKGIQANPSPLEHRPFYLLRSVSAYRRRSRLQDFILVLFDEKGQRLSIHVASPKVLQGSGRSRSTHWHIYIGWVLGVRPLPKTAIDGGLRLLAKLPQNKRQNFHPKG